MRLATQLLSDTVAKALKFVGNGKMDVQAEGLLTCNNWLDVMNSRVAYTNNPYTNGFGINKQIHFQALDKMEKLMKTMKVNGRRAFLPFQRGVLINIQSTRMLYEDLSKQGVRYLRTQRLNQDCLETTFSQVRRVGGEGAHPDAVQFMNRIRTLMMHQKTQHLVKNPNIIEDVDETFLLPSLRRTLVASQAEIEIGEDDDNEDNGDTNGDIDCDSDNDGDQDDCDTSIQGRNHIEGRLYTAGYITRKVNKKFPNDQSNKQPLPSKWISLKSRGYLTYPED